MQTGFRVFGDVLDREDSYLDVTVGGVDETGNIYLVEPGTGGETWSFTAEEIADLYDELLLVGADNIPYPTHELWTDLDNIGSTRKNVSINNFVDTDLMESQKFLFMALVEAGR